VPAYTGPFLPGLRQTLPRNAPTDYTGRVSI